MAYQTQQNLSCHHHTKMQQTNKQRHHSSGKHHSHSCKRHQTHSHKQITHKHYENPYFNQNSSNGKNFVYQQTPQSQYSHYQSRTSSAYCSNNKNPYSQQKFPSNGRVLNYEQDIMNNKENTNVNSSTILNNNSFISQHNPIIPASSRDITTVKAFKYNEKTNNSNDTRLQQKNLGSQINYYQQNTEQVNQLQYGSRSTTVKKECTQHCHHKQNNKDKKCRCKCEHQMNVSFNSNNSCCQRNNSSNFSILNTPVINMEQRFQQDPSSQKSQQLIQNSWNEYNDNPNIIIQSSPISSIKNQLQKNSFLLNRSDNNNIQVQESANKLSTIQSQQSIQSSLNGKKRILQKESFQGSNNINISKLYDNNSALSKHSINSSGVCLDKLISLSQNSQHNNYYLKPYALLDKHGMFASAEMTQGNNSASCHDDILRSQSSLPMFSPLKESDLVMSKKLNLNNNEINNIHNSSLNIIKNNRNTSSPNSLKQSLQVQQLQNAIYNLQPFDLKSPTSSSNNRVSLIHSKSMQPNDGDYATFNINQIKNDVTIKSDNEEFKLQKRDSSISESYQSLNFTLTESNITQHNQQTQSMNQMYQQSRTNQNKHDTHRITASFLQFDKSS